MTEINIAMPQGRRGKKASPDITRDANEFLRAVVETTTDCIMLVARDGRLLQMNAPGLQMIEACSFADVDHVSLYDLIVPEHQSSWRDHHRRVCQGENTAWEFEIVGLKGTRRYLSAHASPIGLADGTVGQLAIARDITLPEPRRECAAASQGSPRGESWRAHSRIAGHPQAPAGQ